MRQNCSYTSPPSARHYTSDLSLWLSVDPMANKYPGLSPYTYCGNNPVKLVDPDGRAWKTADDEAKANDMIKLAQLSIVKNTRLINILKFFVPKSNAREFLINELEERNSYLSEGIEGLQNMGSNTDYRAGGQQGGRWWLAGPALRMLRHDKFLRQARLVLEACDAGCRLSRRGDWLCEDERPCGAGQPLWC